jgi:hypothetical protein
VSEAVGDRLPDAVLEAFDGERLEEKIGSAYLLVTVDPAGTPRPCMLSAGELLAPDDGHLRVALWGGTRTAANLARGAPCLLCFVAPGLALYVRGTPRRLSSVENLDLECFEIAVSLVERDEHPGMPVVDTIRFAVTGQDVGSLVREWTDRLGTLRRSR